MATLEIPGGPDGQRDSGRSDRDTPEANRGQILLVSALVISVLFVALALLLNSAIYAENLGARGTNDGSGHDAVTYRADLTTVAGETLDHVNHNHNSSHTALQRNLSRELAHWERLAVRHEAVSGGTLAVALSGTTNVTNVSQPSTRNMTNAGATSDWTLVNGTTGVRDFRLTVEESSLVGLTATQAENASDLANASAYRIEFASASDRRVYVYDNETENAVAVAVEYPLGTIDGRCHETSGASGTVTVNLTAATVGADPCAPLDFVDDIDSSTTIRYGSGANATGTYALVVNGTLASVDESNYDPPTGDGPYAVGRIHAADVRLTYVTPSVVYRTDISVVGGGGDG